MTRNNTVCVTRLFSTSKKVLFKWLTDPNSIAMWFGPKHLSIQNVKSNFKIGGHYEIKLLKPDSTSFFIGGTYLEIEESTLLKFSFIYSGTGTLIPESVVKITLEEVNPLTTKLTLIQKFESIPSNMENRMRAWEDMLEKLAIEI